VYVRLATAWTDADGVAHGAGDVIDIDAVTLAELEEQGLVDNLDGQEPEDGSGSHTPQSDETSGSQSEKKSDSTDSDSDIGIGPGGQTDIGIGPGGAEE
jgi:hypothetical protein